VSAAEHHLEIRPHGTVLTVMMTPPDEQSEFTIEAVSGDWRYANTVDIR
jgi:hypothetical protein